MQTVNSHLPFIAPVGTVHMHLGVSIEVCHRAYPVLVATFYSSHAIVRCDKAWKGVVGCGLQFHFTVSFCFIVSERFGLS